MVRFSLQELHNCNFLKKSHIMQLLHVICECGGLINIKLHFLAAMEKEMKGKDVGKQKKTGGKYCLINSNVGGSVLVRFHTYLHSHT